MRWERAFSNEHEECGADRIDRKATIVIEHVIQASDVGTSLFFATLPYLSHSLTVVAVAFCCFFLSYSTYHAALVYLL
jgi:hypothetical protein